MNIGQSIFEAIKSISANKVRSGLTILGIVIGVAAVIAMLGIGNGTTQAITSQISKLGTNVLFISAGGDVDNPQPLTLRDAEALQDPTRAPSVHYVAPTIQGMVTASVAGTDTNATLLGITPDYFKVQNVELSEGLAITQSQYDNYGSVVLLGTEVANKLFNSTTNLIGEKVRLNGEIFTVSGVLKSQGGTAFGSSDNQVIVPLSSARVRLINRDLPNEVDMIYAQAIDADHVQSATDEITQILRSRHYQNLGKDDFDIRSTESFLETMNTVTATMTTFLGGIAGISLLVGGIGIMNIMLVTVVERTREIGLRKAVGARRRDILFQFLLESLLLSLSGGIIGILLGYGISFLVAQLTAMSGTAINASITLNSILLASLFSIAVGIFFGLYPASQASKLEPVEALRSE